MIRVGFIGAGGIAHMHARDLCAQPQTFCLTAVADTRADTAAAFAARYGAQNVYADYRQLLARTDIDAVLVAVPHDLHEEVCTAALAAGKHVLVEKPIARTVEEADRIAAAAAAAGRVLLVGHNERYIPAYRKIRQIVESGVLGRIFAAKTDHFQNFDPPAGSWWRDAEAVGGGCVIGSGIHRLDLLLWYLGDAQEVFAHEGYVPRRLSAEALCNASIRFADGAVGSFFCNWGTYAYPYYESMDIYGEEGTIRYDGQDPARFLMTLRQKGGDLFTVEAEPCPTQWQHFAACILDGEPPLVGIREARRALSLVSAIDASARQHVPVILDNGKEGNT